MSTLTYGLMIGMASLVLAPGPVYAGEQGHPKKQSVTELMQRLDKDGDGKLTREEAQAGPAWLTENFDVINTDDDDTIGPEELREYRFKRGADQRTQKWMQTLDKDGDGRISREEAAAGPPWIREKFDQIDRDRDGGLATEELKAHIEQWFRAKHGKKGRE